MSEPVAHEIQDDQPEGGGTPPEQGGTSARPPEGQGGEGSPPSADQEAALQEPTVEALMGFQEFMSLAPRRPSAASTSAALAALKRCMRLQGHDSDGHYSMGQWQAYYAEAMAYTGAPVAR